MSNSAQINATGFIVNKIFFFISVGYSLTTTAVMPRAFKAKIVKPFFRFFHPLFLLLFLLSFNALVLTYIIG